MSNTEYGGPRIDHHRLRDLMVLRLRRYVDERAAAIHAARMRQWTESDREAFPTWAEALVLAQDEARTLTNALGAWAWVSPDYLDQVGKAMPRRFRRPGLPPTPWERELLGE